MLNELIAGLILGVLCVGVILHFLWMLFWSKDARALRRKAQRTRRAEQLLDEKRYRDALVELGVLNPQD